VALLIQEAPGRFNDDVHYRGTPRPTRARAAVVASTSTVPPATARLSTDAISQHWGDRPGGLQKGWAAALQQNSLRDADRACIGRELGGSWTNGIACNWNQPWNAGRSRWVFDSRGMYYSTGSCGSRNTRWRQLLTTIPRTSRSSKPGEHVKEWRVTIWYHRSRDYASGPCRVKAPSRACNAVAFPATADVHGRVPMGEEAAETACRARDRRMAGSRNGGPAAP